MRLIDADKIINYEVVIQKNKNKNEEFEKCLILPYEHLSDIPTVNIDKKCKFCDYNSNECEIFFDPLTNEWYDYHRTDEYDEITQEWIHEKIYINFCPWCGRELKE